MFRSMDVHAATKLNWNGLALLHVNKLLVLDAATDDQRHRLHLFQHNAPASILNCHYRGGTRTQELTSTAVSSEDSRIDVQVHGLLENLPQ